MILSSIKKIINNPKKIVLYLAGKGILNWLPDELYLRLIYRIRVGDKLDLNDPLTFNEKLQWLKLNDRQPFYSILVDKLEVRKYIADMIGEDYLIPLIGVYNSIDEIDFDYLPNQFVLKCTHDSGGIVICRDKDQIDIESVKKKLNMYMKRNYFFHGREWPYKDIKPRIICEKYMVDESETELKDYKFMCFNGKPKCMFVCLNRFSDNGPNMDYYDLEWNPIQVERHHKNSGTLLPRPVTFEKMIEIAEKLSADIPFVRVDFYEVNGRLYFGELTLYPASGFEKYTPETYEYLFGSWIDLP
jgi:hypothetical protein